MRTEVERELLRSAAEAEDGLCVSAGGRMAHLAAARESGRIVELDFSEVPPDDRPDVLEEIREIINRARKSGPLTTAVRHAS
jgi:predicted NBD/HSP70 family sugar kinase